MAGAPSGSRARAFRARTAIGDLYATVRIVLPHDPDPDLDELMQRWRDKKPYDPRGNKS